MSRLAKDIWTGLRTGPARSGLAFLSLALGLFAVTILLATLDALRHQAHDLVQQFGAGSFMLVRPAGQGGGGTWTRERVEAFRAHLEDSAVVSGIKPLPALPGVDFPVVAVDGALAMARGWRFPSGRGLDEEDIRHADRHAMASVSLCQRQGWREGQIIRIGREPYRLVGGVEDENAALPGVKEGAVFIPYTADALDNREEESTREVEVLVFRARPGTMPEQLRRRVAVLQEQPDGLGAEVEWITPESLLAGIRRWQRAIGWTAGSGGVLGLLLGAVTLGGLLLTGVRERIPEIGLRRALGARRLDVAGLFVAEALVLTGMEALTGMAGAEGALRWLGARFPLPFHFGAGARLVPLVLATGIALLCSLGPAWRAARMPPAEALRNE